MGFYGDLYGYLESQLTCMLIKIRSMVSLSLFIAEEFCGVCVRELICVCDGVICFSSMSSQVSFYVLTLVLLVSRSDILLLW